MQPTYPKAGLFLSAELCIEIKVTQTVFLLPLQGGGRMRLRETRTASDLFYPLTAPASRGEPSAMPRVCPGGHQCSYCFCSPLPSWGRVRMNQPEAHTCPPSPPKSHTLGSRVCSFIHPQHYFLVIFMLIQGLSTLAGEGPSPVGYLCNSPKKSST